MMMLINPQTLEKTMSMLSNFTELLWPQINKDLLVSSFQDVLLSSLVVEIKFPLFLMLMVSNVEYSVPIMVLEIFILFFLILLSKMLVP